jgi:hypothetical protein
MIAASGTLAGAALAGFLLLFFHILGYNPAWYYWVVICVVGAALGCFCAIGHSELNIEKIEQKEKIHQHHHGLKLQEKSL